VFQQGTAEQAGSDTVVARPQKLGDVLAQLTARHGFARVRSQVMYDDAWRDVAGDLANRSRVGALRRGVLEITVSHSTLVQEMLFQKPRLLEGLASRLPGQEIKDLKFRVGAVT
jgi:predicted nucleic acid-binding Zn ribbon protein